MIMWTYQVHLAVEQTLPQALNINEAIDQSSRSKRCRFCCAINFKSAYLNKNATRIVRVIPSSFEAWRTSWVNGYALPPPLQGNRDNLLPRRHVKQPKRVTVNRNCSVPVSFTRSAPYLCPRLHVNAPVLNLHIIVNFAPLCNNNISRHSEIWDPGSPGPK